MPDSLEQTKEESSAPYRVNITSEQFRAWMEALRSGQYHRGVGKLASYTGSHWCHCPLGVLAEVLDLFSSEIPGICGPTKIIEEHVGDGQYGEGFKSGFVPSEIISYEVQADVIIPLNDNVGLDFEDVADWMERNLVAVG